MTSARWERLKELFAAGQELEQEAWPKFAADSCKDDLALRDELLQTLRAHAAAADDFLVSPAASPTTAQQIGGYTLGRILGVGGMGTVYEATQDAPSRTVALKVLRSRGASPALQRRLETEAEILARLQHPGIAQIHAAGTAAVQGADVPWFAMELVPQAQTLTEYVVAAELDEGQSIALFLQICDAVQHAHQKGVVHRDLKPGNILVDEHGTPKIIDFGVARVTDTDLDASLRTQAGEVIGTLSYMSPEQCSGGITDVDTRSDVYSLGVVFYEILTDELPLDVGGRSLPNAVQAIVEEAPRRAPTLMGDLEAIVFKAIDKDPERRYDSAATLAEDVRRHLASEPISARPPTFSYHLRLFARRHRAVFAAGTIVVLGLAVAAGVSSYFGWQASVRADQAVEAREVANEERDAADHTLGLLTRAILAANPMLEAKEVPVGALLDRVAAELERDPDFPTRVRARVHHVLCSAYRGLGRHGDAILHADLALAALADLPEPSHEETLNVRMIRGVALAGSGERDRAVQEFESAIAFADRELPDNAHSAVALRARLAGLHTIRGSIDAAKPILADAMAIAEARGVGGTALAEACANMGTVEWSNQRPDEAARLWQRSLDLFAKDLWSDHPLVVRVRSNYGLHLQDQKDFEGAEAMFRGALDSSIARYGEHDPAVANALLKLGYLAIDRRELDAATTAFERALAIRRQAFGEDAMKVPEAMDALGYLLLQREQWAAAREVVEESLALRLRSLPERSAVVAKSQLLLGRAHLGSGDAAAAAPLLEAAAKTRAAGFGPISPPTAMARSALGECRVLEGELQEAELLLTETYPSIEAAVGRDHPEARVARRRLVVLYVALGLEDEAARWREP